MSFQDFLIKNYPGANTNDAAAVALVCIAAERYAEMQLDHVKEIADSMAKRCRAASIKAAQNGSTFGDSRRSAADVEFGEASAYEHLRDHVIPSTKKTFTKHFSVA